MFFFTLRNFPSQHDLLFLYLQSNVRVTDWTFFFHFSAKPLIDESVQYSRAASDEGNTGKLTCKAYGAPEITFTWSREGSIIDTDGEKYDEESSQVDFKTYESVLSISNVVPSEDYGEYLCVAKNEEGFYSSYIKFEGTGKYFFKLVSFSLSFPCWSTYVNFNMEYRRILFFCIYFF